MIKIVPLPHDKLIAVHRQVLAHGVSYLLSAKPQLSDGPGDFDESDCSGYVAWLPHYVTGGAFVLTGGSQQMRTQCEAAGLHKVASYADLGKYCTGLRIFICFIEPFVHGCGAVGHVWLVLMIDGRVLTIECHGGKGVDSRPWDTHVLFAEEAEAFELPSH